jgi:hypothetical protein
MKTIFVFLLFVKMLFKKYAERAFAMLNFLLQNIFSETRYAAMYEHYSSNENSITEPGNKLHVFLLPGA